MGLGMVVIAWGTPLSADTGPDDTVGWFSARTQPTKQIAADLRNDGMNILLARGGGGGGQGKGGGKGRGPGGSDCQKQTEICFRWEYEKCIDIKHPSFLSHRDIRK